MTNTLEEVQKEWEGDTTLLGEVINAKLTDGSPMVVVRAVLHVGTVPENDHVSVLRYINVGAIRGETHWEVSVDLDQGEPVKAIEKFIHAVNIGRR